MRDLPKRPPQRNWPCPTSAISPARRPNPAGPRPKRAPVAKAAWGNKIKGRTKRALKSNLKKLRILVDGEIKRVWVSTSAIKSGLVVKPLKYKIKAKVAAKA